jgi:hypothetical protein
MRQISIGPYQPVKEAHHSSTFKKDDNMLNNNNQRIGHSGVAREDKCKKDDIVVTNTALGWSRYF